MSGAGPIAISNIWKISAIYYALLQCGYDSFSIQRGSEHIHNIEKFIHPREAFQFFSAAKQNTCEVYPWWPRAAILETASFYLQPDGSAFRDYQSFREYILSATNITDKERDQNFWDWIAEFPAALTAVWESEGFHHYLQWENQWIQEQNAHYEKELRTIQSCLEICVNTYRSPVRDIQMIINPIKCVYSTDYHLFGGSFIFSSGTFCEESVIHEFLHHVIHPYMQDMEIEKNIQYPGIDDSYYLNGKITGQLNAFEEYAVRELTKEVISGHYPEDIFIYLKDLIV